MLATMTPMSWPFVKRWVGADTDVEDDAGVDDVNVNDAEAEEVKDVKDTDEDVVAEGVAGGDKEEVVNKVEEEEVGVGNDEGGITEVVVIGVDVGADVVDTGVEAGDVRPPYVQSEFRGICGK